MPRCSPFALGGALILLFALLPAHAQSTTAKLPDGVGRDLVAAVCAGCHDARPILRSSGYDADQWRELIGTMIDLSASTEDHRAIVRYLAEHFTPNTARAAKQVAGPDTISFKTWLVPTLGQRPRDPIEAADGTIWWAGQWGNLIGRINPKTGEMAEFPLPANAMPHTVTLDRQGNVWYTGNKNATIGKFDPTSTKITEYVMPNAKARDPHSAIFDGNGILWFTLQHSNMIGRLDPTSGVVKLVTSKTAGAKPYGIKLDANGVPWVACNGSACLIKVDPETMELTEIKLPIAGTTVRRLDIAGDGSIWYVNSGKGRLGRYDPVTGAIKEWPSPSGAKSHPYAIAVINGVVWYNESGVRPDMLVRFDPKSEKFQSWPIPSGGVHAGIIRHMRATRDGNLLIHQSSTNRIMLVQLPQSKAAQ
jgi:virginiamycin B lyase